MSKKLKCWKKFGKIGEVDICRNFNGKKVTLRKKKDGYSVNTFTNSKKNVKTRKEAIKFAKSYMKKHNKC